MVVLDASKMTVSKIYENVIQEVPAFRDFRIRDSRHFMIGVSAELGVSPGMELTRMSPEEIQGATISYG